MTLLIGVIAVPTHFSYSIFNYVQPFHPSFFPPVFSSQNEIMIMEPDHNNRMKRSTMGRVAASAFQCQR